MNLEDGLIHCINKGIPGIETTKSRQESENNNSSSICGNMLNQTTIIGQVPCENMKKITYS